MDTRFTPILVNVSLKWRADDHLGAVTAAELKLLAKVRRLCEVTVNIHSSWFPLDLRFEGKIIGKGAYDVNSEGDIENALWTMAEDFLGFFDGCESQEITLV